MDYAELLARAREHYGVPALETVDDVGRFLRSLGATEFEWESHLDSLADEFVDRSQIVAAFTIDDPDLLRRRANRREFQMFYAEPPAEWESPESMPAWYATEFGRGQVQVSHGERLNILIESSKADPDLIGGFRIHGAGQWLRESLWAGTGVVPRDLGTVLPEDSELFLMASTKFGRQSFDSSRKGKRGFLSRRPWRIRLR